MKKIFKLKRWDQLLVIRDSEELLIYKKKEYKITHTFFTIEIIRPITHLIIEEYEDVNLDSILKKLVDLKMLEEICIPTNQKRRRKKKK